MKNKKLIIITIVSIIIIAGIVTSLVILLNRPKPQTTADKIAPNVNIISPIENVYSNNAQLLNINATDNVKVDRIWYNWDGTNQTYTSPVNITFGLGMHTLYAWANDSAGNVGSSSIKFDISSGNFISVWNTSINSSDSSNSDQIKLPLQPSGTYLFNVNWGDGNINLITSGDQSEVTHTYATQGIYTLNITGYLNGWSFNNGGDAQKLLNIQQWGNLQLGNSGGYFAGCSNLQNITSSDMLNLKGTTDLSMMFFNCSMLNKIENINSWDVSSVTDMSGMFDNAWNFNQNISSWDVSSVTDMSYMFAGSYDGPPSIFNQTIGNWNVSSVTDMSYMFCNEENFNQNIDNWNVSSVTDMSGIFGYAWCFNQNISKWDVSSVTDMSGMFYYALVFNQSISKWDVSSVTDMNNMFNGAHDFNQNISKWDVSSVTNMSSMFFSSRFNQNIDNWTVSSVTDMSYMFCNEENFNQNISSWDVSNVTDMSSMFNYAIDFNQNLGSWDVSNVQKMNYMFTGVTLSQTNINDTLTGWYNLSSLQTGVHLGYGNTAPSQSLQTELTNKYNWSFGHS